MIMKIILLFPIGFFPNSKCQIEIELMRIIMQNWRLDDLILAQLDNTKLMKVLCLVQSRSTTGTLADLILLNFTDSGKSFIIALMPQLRISQRDAYSKK